MPKEAIICIYLFCSAVLLFFASRPTQRPWRKKLLLVFVVGSILAPVFIDRTPRNFAQAIVLLFLLSLERLIPSQAISFFSSENLKSAAFISLKRVASLGFIVALVSQILAWPALPWALKTHLPFWAQALAALFVLDFMQFVWHFLRHKVDFLWRFHKLHHATEELSLFAAGRDNLIEWAPRQVVFQGIMLYGLGISFEAYLYGYIFPALVIDGMNHMNVDFPQRKWLWLSRFVSLPNTHAIHHAPDGDRSNYGFMFMFWDVLFGTFKTPLSRPTEFGLASRELDNMGIVAQHVYSLRECLPSLVVSLNATINSKNVRG